MMMFRLGFFGPFFVDGSLFLAQLLVFKIIYSNIEKIGTWSQAEMILYIGSFSLINAFNMMLFFLGLNSLPYKIRSGELDLYLVKPISPLFRISFEQINPGAMPLIIMSILIILYGHSLGNFGTSLLQVCTYIFWILIMCILFYDVEVLMRAVTLYTVSATRFNEIEEVGLELCMQLPGIVFYGVYKVIFCIVVPYGIMATLPVKNLVGEMAIEECIFGIMIVVFFSFLVCIVWKKGIRYYNSASS